jgi:hypothetical protein
MLDDSDPNKFIAKMGAEALYDLLSQLDLDKESYALRDRAIRKLLNNGNKIFSKDASL